MHFRCRQFVEMVNGTDSEVCCLTVRSPKSQDSYPGSPILSPHHGGSNTHLHTGGTRSPPANIPFVCWFVSGRVAAPPTSETRSASVLSLRRSRQPHLQQRGDPQQQVEESQRRWKQRRQIPECFLLCLLLQFFLPFFHQLLRV